MFLPASHASLIDCVNLNNFQKINNTKLNSRTTDRGMLMNLKSLDENRLLASFENGELVLYDIRVFEEVSSVEVLKAQPIMCFDYDKKSNFGITGSMENLMFQFNVDDKRLNISNSITLTNPGLNCVKIRTNDSKIFASGGTDSRIRVYGIKKQNLLAVLDFHKESINTIDFSRTNLMAAGSNDGIISIWNIYS